MTCYVTHAIPISSFKTLKCALPSVFTQQTKAVTQISHRLTVNFLLSGLLPTPNYSLLCYTVTQQTFSKTFCGFQLKLSVATEVKKTDAFRGADVLCICMYGSYTQG